jgi:hypothetical protein
MCVIFNTIDDINRLSKLENYITHLKCAYSFNQPINNLPDSITLDWFF